MNKWVAQVLNKFGFESLNSMQEKSIPFLESNKEALLVAPTGSGKTLTYLLALLPFLREDREGQVQCLIIVPTRELALQIESTVRKMGSPYKVNACYGGHSMEVEKRNLQFAPAILIGTPGRLRDHVHRGHLQLQHATSLILDEFDKSLEMGFQDDMDFLIKKVGIAQRKWLCSATATDNLPDFVGLSDPKYLVIESKVKQRLMFHLVKGKSGKRQRLYALLEQLPTEASIVFCNQKDTVGALYKDLIHRGMDVITFHGDLDQREREISLAKFRNGSANILIATDLAARGIDIPELNHVIHYDLPDKEDTFTHRCGRTARVARNGNVYLIQKESELSDYIPNDLEELILNESHHDRAPSDWVTFYVSGGKKNKINKIDLVGFFIKIGRLEKDEVGLIEVKDFMSFVAIKRNCAQQVLALCRGQKIKKQKHRIEIAR